MKSSEKQKIIAVIIDDKPTPKSRVNNLCKKSSQRSLDFSKTISYLKGLQLYQIVKLVISKSCMLKVVIFPATIEIFKQL